MPVPEAAPAFPGLPNIADGSGAVVWVETQISEAATAYPITPTTNMGVGFQEAVSNGTTNLWGTKLSFVELESEHSAASACEGFAVAGGRVSNFTSGQGLILMKEVLYTIAGKRLPMVFNIGARALTSQSLNVHCGHDDIMGVTDVGWGMIFGRNAQEAADLALISRRVSESTATPFFNVQDGFLTTHTIESMRMPEPELMKQFVGDPRAKLLNLMDPDHPMMVGVVQNQDSYMKGKVAQRSFYDRIKQELKAAMEEYSRLTGRRYGLISSSHMEDAEYAVVGMGTGLETVEGVIPYIRQKYGIKLGAIHVTSFRPFPSEELAAALSKVKAVSVIERLDVPLAQSNPLTAELKAALLDHGQGRAPRVLSGVYGLGSRDFRPEDVVAIAQSMIKADGKKLFACNLKHPLGLETEPFPASDRVSKGTSFSMRGHSVGGFGSVTTNKILATVGGDVFHQQVQAYPKYGSEKKGLPTTYYLTLAEEKVMTHCELSAVDFVVLNDINAFKHANPMAGLRPNGQIFLQSVHESPEEVLAQMPEKSRRQALDNHIKVYYLDTNAVARELAPTADLAQRMQGIVFLGVFLKVTPFQQQYKLQADELFTKLRKPLSKYFGRRGDQVVDANLAAARRGYDKVHEISREDLQRSLAQPAKSSF